MSVTEQSYLILVLYGSLIIIILFGTKMIIQLYKSILVQLQEIQYINKSKQSNLDSDDESDDEDDIDKKKRDREVESGLDTNVLKITSNVNKKTFLRFEKAYKQADKNKDILIIINTPGGDDDDCYNICNIIMNHIKKRKEQKNKEEKECLINNNENYNIKSLIKKYDEGQLGKIKCFILNGASSAGCQIALVCDEIIMTDLSWFSPADLQIIVDKIDYSLNEILHVVKYKRENKFNIKPVWLASEYHALQKLEEERRSVNILLSHYDNQIKNKIYDEFFSGKNSHSCKFTYDDIKDFGLNITFMKNMPDDIDGYLD
ncbi:MAG: hypothetical protein Edafosvirus4_23 [Edafosvirus sp.]|uniref:Uncharacterized protein n=1 Tax=Edafosvirus sp. TaxID=2487765 RepID=A0A3G4ZX81_9VIRU|nr:MAG: hypothetical protein Edafosvirus4_23 [Edafosvirus sp.]